MPEHTVIQAVYHNGELYGFIGNIAHVTEIGGKAVGGFAADAKEVYQEGLRLPPSQDYSRRRTRRGHLENYPRKSPDTTHLLGRFPRDARIA